MPVAPPTLTGAPAVPDRADRPTFSARATAFFDWLKNTFVGEMGALAANVFGNANAALASAVDSAASAAAAAESQALAASAAQLASAGANFKGDWAGLSGPLARPASVRHAGLFWALLADLADVAASEPGVSAHWAALDAGVMPSKTMTGSETAVPGVTYLCPNAAWVLTWPASLVKGQRLGYVNTSAAEATVNCAGHKVRARPVDADAIAVGPGQGHVFVYEDSTTGVY